MSKNDKTTQSTQLKYMVICAIFVAASIALNQVKLFHMPYGGSVTLLSMLAGTLAGYFCGPKWGLLAGFALGLLNLLTGYVTHPIQLILDYPAAFGALGLSGFFNKQKYGLYIGYIVAVLGRFVFSFISGFVFFGSYAPEGMNPVIYSFLYQIQYIGVEAIITLAVLAVPVVHNNIYKLKATL